MDLPRGSTCEAMVDELLLPVVVSNHNKDCGTNLSLYSFGLLSRHHHQHLERVLALSPSPLHIHRPLFPYPSTQRWKTATWNTVELVSIVHVDILSIVDRHRIQLTRYHRLQEQRRLQAG